MNILKQKFQLWYSKLILQQLSFEKSKIIAFFCGHLIIENLTVLSMCKLKFCCNVIMLILTFCESCEIELPVKVTCITVTEKLEIVLLREKCKLTCHFKKL